MCIYKAAPRVYNFDRAKIKGPLSKSRRLKPTTHRDTTSEKKETRTGNGFLDRSHEPTQSINQHRSRTSTVHKPTQKTNQHSRNSTQITNPTHISQAKIDSIRHNSSSKQHQQEATAATAAPNNTESSVQAPHARSGRCETRVAQRDAILDARRREIAAEWRRAPTWRLFGSARLNASSISSSSRRHLCSERG